MDRFAFLRATLSPRGEGACGDGQGGAKLLFAGASCFFDEDGRVLYFAPTKQASVCVCVSVCVSRRGVVGCSRVRHREERGAGRCPPHMC